MELEEIAKEEEIVLLDTSINQLDNFLWEIFPTKSYNKILIPKIVATQEKIEKVIKFIDEKNVFSIEEVHKEMGVLLVKLSAKAKEFNKIERHCKKTFKRKEIKINPENRKSYVSLLDVTNHLISRLNHKLIKIKEPKVYEIFYNRILKFNEEYKLTENRNEYPEKERLILKLDYLPEDNEEKLRTDEKLAAMLFYLSIIENKSGVLISGDAGIKRLVEEYYKSICKNNSEECKYFKEMLIKNPAKIYLPCPIKSCNYQLEFSSKIPYSLSEENSH